MIVRRDVRRIVVEYADGSQDTWTGEGYVEDHTTLSVQQVWSEEEKRNLTTTDPVHYMQVLLNNPKKADA